MIKKIISAGIALLVLGSIGYTVYKNPETILDTKTQENLLKAGDNLDKSLEELFTNTGSETNTGETK